MNERSFPADFTWGAATAAFQVEGATHEDGRSDCVWDVFCRKPGAIVNGDTGDIATDHYHRYKEDVELLSGLGLDSYRFSLAWPRLFPDGTGKRNPAGFAFYHRLLDELEKRGIEPCVTLYHWDLPQVLEDKGGWRVRETAFAFRDYADACFQEFGKRVKWWITLNEPFCAAYLGYRDGVFAPGAKDLTAAIRAVHHLNLAHGLAVKAFRDSGLSGRIGIVWNLVLPRPATRSPEDAAAAERVIEGETRMFTDPVLGRGYPGEYLERKGLSVPVEKGDMETISLPMDFCGLNYYTERAVRHDPKSPDGTSFAPSWEPVTDIGWEITPEGFARALKWLAGETRGLPIYVTENGCAERDFVGPDGRVRDTGRIAYIRSHLGACLRAMDDGVPVKGYFAWSFIDNFEWAQGYGKRFGLVYCDYPTQRRVPKDSYHFFRDVVAGHISF